jgi:hypothetical protein
MSRNAIGNGINSIYYPQNQFLLTSTNATVQQYNTLNVPVDVNNPGRYYSLVTFLSFVGKYYDNNPAIISTIKYDANYNKNIDYVFTLVNNQYTGLSS